MSLKACEDEFRMKVAAEEDSSEMEYPPTDCLLDRLETTEAAPLLECTVGVAVASPSLLLPAVESEGAYEYVPIVPGRGSWRRPMAPPRRRCSATLAHIRMASSAEGQTKR